ncbi:uncharacterized protein LOC142767189 [Rhipicephalus microplus]|uniref:uncharacterized protein LOC142767189 n=1 Tax=Rhipicephalus microplus TaxID=6941 RepID=UPI003F6A54B9
MGPLLLQRGGSYVVTATVVVLVSTVSVLGCIIFIITVLLQSGSAEDDTASEPAGGDFKYGYAKSVVVPRETSMMVPTVVSTRRVTTTQVTPTREAVPSEEHSSREEPTTVREPTTMEKPTTREQAITTQEPITTEPPWTTEHTTTTTPQDTNAPQVTNTPQDTTNAPASYETTNEDYVYTTHEWTGSPSPEVVVAQVQGVPPVHTHRRSLSGTRSRRECLFLHQVVTRGLLPAHTAPTTRKTTSRQIYVALSTGLN